MKRSGLALHWQILIAIALAVLVGSVIRSHAGDGVEEWLAVFEFGGRIFLGALKMLIVPLIASSMIVGVASLGAHGQLGRIGLRTFGLYAITTAAAILVGLALINIVRPGVQGGAPAGAALALQSDPAEVARVVESRGAADIAEIFVRMVPENVIAAAADNGEILGVIVFSLLFGYFMTKISDEHARPLLAFWRGVSEVMLLITEFVMRFAPLGVFFLVSRVVAKTGLAAATPLLQFSACVVAGLALQMFVILPLSIRLITGARPWAIFSAMAPALLTAFSTASSAASMPLALDCVEKRLRVSNRIASFVIPIGSSANSNGTALYECAAVVFIAQAYGVAPGFLTQLTVVGLALVTSMGIAGIPASSLVAIAVILGALGLPPEAIGVLLVFDRPLDMCRTTVNVFGDACVAAIVARLEGERHVLEPASAG